jgi:catechol 2,3-dioxygenase-like lactoylglutathione lyase family enzyme
MDGLVKGLVWVGSRTEHYEEMVRFYRDALRLPLEHEEGEFALFRLPDGSKAEVFGPSDTEHTHFTRGPGTNPRSFRARCEPRGTHLLRAQANKARREGLGRTGLGPGSKSCTVDADLSLASNP